MKLQRPIPLFTAIAGEPQFANREWFRAHVDAADPDTAHLYFQDEIGFFGTKPADVVAQLNAIKTPRITMHINSPGGSVFDGFQIFNVLRAHPAEKTAVVEGLSASIATVIMLAANKVRFAKNAQMMIHNPACAVFGDSAYLRKQSAVLDDLRDSIVEIYREKTGKTRAELIKAMDAETWLPAKEAKAWGFADIVSDEIGKAENAFDLTGFKNAPAAEQPPAVAPLALYRRRLELLAHD